MQKKALLTGITGMDASHMADLLLEKGYEVYGLVRRSASPNHWRIEHIKDKLKLIEGDLTDKSSLENAIRISQADEIYNFGAQSFVQYSFQAPLATIEATGIGAFNLFEASTSEQFGKITETPQNERTRFYPRSPYGCAKAFAHHIAVNYREAYNMHISCGILFNHESQRRGTEFVTRKITEGVARIKMGLQDKIVLGNLNASRDWSHARDMMQGVWLLLQQDKPMDLVLGSGETHTVKEWLEKTCEVAGLNYWDVYSQSPTMERQSEVDYLRADPSLAFSVLGWKTTVSFDELVREMYEADYENLQKNR